MGFWSGVKSGFVGAAKGTWEGVKGAGSYAWDFATDGQTRSDAWDATTAAANSAGDYAAASWSDPSKPFRDLGNAGASAYASAEEFVRTADAEAWGELAGGGAFTAATLPVGGLAAKGVARAGSAVNTARRAGKLTDNDAEFCERCAAGQRADPKRKPFHRQDLDEAWYDPETGELRWPPNDGFDGPPTAETLQPGTQIDRFSGRSGVDDSGSYFSPAGASFESRALPYDRSMQTHAVYEVENRLAFNPARLRRGSINPGARRSI